MERIVLHSEDIMRSLKHLAFEVVKKDSGSGDLVLLDIPTRSVGLTERLGKLLVEVGGITMPVEALNITLYHDGLARQPTRVPRSTAILPGRIDRKVIVLIDDVLFSGRAICVTLDALNDHGQPATVRLAVLVDRGHHELPVRAGYMNEDLPTSRREQVPTRLVDSDGQDAVVIQGRVK